MFIESTPYLVYMFENIDKVMLIFARMVGFIYLLPIFSGLNVPTRVKLGFSFILAVVIFSSGMADTSIVADSAIAYAIIICKEVLTGMCIGFIVYTFFAIFYFAGQMLDYSIGFSMVNVFDPVTQIQVPITGNFIYFIMATLFIVTGGLNTIMAAFFESYVIIPIGGTNFLAGQGMADFMIGMTATYLSLGLRIASPIVGTILIVDVALGILVKASPQMNVFVVGMPIKLLVGLVMLFIICPFFINIYNEIFNLMYGSVTNLIGGMSY